MIRSPPSRAALWPPLVVLAVVVLLPVGRASELPLAIGVLAAIVLLAQGRIDRRDAALRLPLILFACYALPALVSAVAPIAPARTWSTVASIVRFVPFAVFTVWALRDARRWSVVIVAVAAVVSLWAIDAYAQMITGYSLAGAAEAERLSGIFGAGNLKLGPVLAVLSPFVLVAARDALGWRGLGLAFVFLAVPILLAGSRAAWLMYALVCAVVAWRQARSKRAFVLALAGAVVLAGAATTIALRDSPGFDARVERSLLALGGTESALDTASAGFDALLDAVVAGFRAPQLAGTAQHLAHGARDVARASCHRRWRARLPLRVSGLRIAAGSLRRHRERHRRVARAPDRARSAERNRHRRSSRLARRRFLRDPRMAARRRARAFARVRAGARARRDVLSAEHPPCVLLGVVGPSVLVAACALLRGSRERRGLGRRLRATQ